MTWQDIAIIITVVAILISLGLEFIRILRRYY